MCAVDGDISQVLFSFTGDNFRYHESEVSYGEVLEDKYIRVTVLYIRVTVLYIRVTVLH
jgi:hypothetical protein